MASAIPRATRIEALSATLQLDPVRNVGLRLAKALNFRLLFGTGVEGFAENANIPIEEAEEAWLIVGVACGRRWCSGRTGTEVGAGQAPEVRDDAVGPAGQFTYDVDPNTKNLRFKPNRALNVPIQGWLRRGADGGAGAGV